MKQFFPILVLLFSAFVWQCSDDFKPSEAYLKVYDDSDANKNYHPKSILQTTDGGYLILSATNKWSIYLMKVDAEGKFVWQYEGQAPYVNPVPQLLEVNGKYYMLCMDQTGLFTYILNIDANSGSVSPTGTISAAVYPLAAAVVDGKLMLQFYNRYSFRTGILLADFQGNVLASEQFGIYEDIEVMLIDHLTHEGKRFPFSVGSAFAGKYYYSGFYNYSFSLVFLNDNLSFSGVYNGPNYDGHFNALGFEFTPLPLAWSSYGNHYFNLSAALDPNSISVMEDVGGTPISELAEETEVQILSLVLGNKKFICFAADSKSGEIVLFLYDAGNQTLTVKKEIGGKIPFHLADLIQTEDGGIAVLAKVFVAGSFSRIAIYKISDEELKELAGIEE